LKNFCATTNKRDGVLIKVGVEKIQKLIRGDGD